MQEINHSLLDRKKLKGILDLESEFDIGEILTSSLLKPIQDFLSRPSKKIRSELVKIGFALGANSTHEFSESETQICAEASNVLEQIHAASLVIDDIQDGSLERRGAPTLHRQIGLPVALNAGNWLYFWPFEKIHSWQIPAERKLAAIEICHRTLLRAHFGQAIDVSVAIDKLPQEQVYEVCLASLRLKTGALMSMAFSLGAVLNGASAERIKIIDSFAHRFGIALQMFDDIGNFSKSDSDCKKYEDIKLRRPSWVFAIAAAYSLPAEYSEFLSSLNKLPNDSELKYWAEKNQLIKIARLEANKYLNEALDKFKKQVGDRKEIALIENLVVKLKVSYE